MAKPRRMPRYCLTRREQLELGIEISESTRTDYERDVKKLWERIEFFEQAQRICNGWPSFTCRKVVGATGIVDGGGSWCSEGCRWAWEYRQEIERLWLQIAKRRLKVARSVVWEQSRRKALESPPEESRRAESARCS